MHQWGKGLTMGCPFQVSRVLIFELSRAVCLFDYVLSWRVGAPVGRLASLLTSFFQFSREIDKTGEPVAARPSFLTWRITVLDVCLLRCFFFLALYLVFVTVWLECVS